MRSDVPQKMSTGEFVALIAMLFSTIAFSMDAMLPAMPNISEELGSGDSTHLILSVFMAGLAIGTLFAGPVSDTIGRKKAMYLGCAIYVASGTVAWLSNSFEVIVLARFVQGFGAAGPRVVSMAIARDLYEGRQMARVISFAMVIFTLVPALAPTMGYWLANSFGWRAILLSFNLFALISVLWLWLRLNEPLKPENRRSLRLSQLWSAGREVLSHPIVRLAILAQGVAFGVTFSLLMQVQPVYDQVFNRGDTFHYWFGAIALISAASTSLANAALVVRFGMLRLVTLGMIGHVVCASLTLCVILLAPEVSFLAFVVWQFMVIWIAGMCVGNLNAIALEPMGHIAGMAASLSGAISTLLASLVAGGVGFLFNGTAIPLLLSALIMGSIGTSLMWRMNALARGQTQRI